MTTRTPVLAVYHHTPMAGNDTLSIYCVTSNPGQLEPTGDLETSLIHHLVERTIEEGIFDDDMDCSMYAAFCNPSGQPREDDLAPSVNYGDLPGALRGKTFEIEVETSQSLDLEETREIYSDFDISVLYCRNPSYRLE